MDTHLKISCEISKSSHHSLRHAQRIHYLILFSMMPYVVKLITQTSDKSAADIIYNYTIHILLCNHLWQCIYSYLRWLLCGQGEHPLLSLKIKCHLYQLDMLFKMFWNISSSLISVFHYSSLSPKTIQCHIQFLSKFLIWYIQFL